jgi:cytochrome c oxidase cbb3-type subunit IV
MDFETASRLSQTWGLVLLVILFIIVVSYAFWPKNRDRFRQAATIPLQDDNAFSKTSNIEHDDRDTNDR